VTLAPWLCALTHAVAFVALPLLLRGGMLAEPEATARSAYISENVNAWTIGWALWMLSAMTLVGFYAWWGSQLAVGQAPPDDSNRIRQAQPDLHTARITALAAAVGQAPPDDGHRIRQAQPDLHITTTAVIITAIGTVFDFSGEGLSILLLVERAATFSQDPAAFASAERAFTLLSAGVANGLYTLGGLMLMLATPDLPSLIRAAMWVTWLAGAAMTIAGVMNYVGGMVASTAVLFPLLIAWTIWMGARWRRP
jgi:hypothetical protein